MGLKKKLKERKSAVSKAWLDRILETYPHRTAAAWTKEKDPFANPVGHTLRESTRAIVSGLLDGAEPDALAELLEPIVKVRSIQEFSPSQALSFVYVLKEVVREELADGLKEPKLLEELSRFDSEIDRLALLSFDIYTKCRERVCELRINEVKRSVSSLLRRAELIVDDPEPEQGQDKPADSG